MIIFLMGFFLLPADQRILAAENQPSIEESENASGMDQPEQPDQTVQPDQAGQEAFDQIESHDGITEEEPDSETDSEEMTTETPSREETTEAEEVTEVKTDDTADDTVSDEEEKSVQTPEEDDDTEAGYEADENNDKINDEKNDVVIRYDEIVRRIKQSSDLHNKISAKSSNLPLLYGNIPNDACKITLTGNGKTFSIKGTVNSAYRLGQVFVDAANDQNIAHNFNYATGSINKSGISLSRFGTGYHNVIITVYDKSNKLVDALYQGYVPYNGITAKPTYKGKFTVNTRSFIYYPYNMAMSNREEKLFMEYSANGGKSWKRTGYMQANMIKLAIDQCYTFGGLKANTVYRTRIRYGVYIDYLEKSYLFLGPVLNTTTFKTGKAKAPKIKSVKIKAIKVKRHKHRVAGHYYWTGYRYIWISGYTERYYTCKFKLTIKLKKKPGAKGIWVDGTFLKGNKKKYTKIITPTYNYYRKKPPKGLKKVKISIKSYQSKSYGGFSPAKTKKVKIK